MSDTPRVDAFIASHPWVAGQSQDMINFAKELELELHNTLPSDLSELIKFWRTFPPSSNEVAAAEIIEKLQRIRIRPEAKSPVSRSRAALPANIRKTLEESNIPVEVATAIADLCEGKIARPEVGVNEQMAVHLERIAECNSELYDSERLWLREAAAVLRGMREPQGEER